MLTKFLSYGFTIALCLASFTSCKKLDGQKFVESEDLTQNTLTPYLFDWEKADFMPTPAGISIKVPWASGGNPAFPLQYGVDIRKADGWELLYNTFNPDRFESPAYFILYNRYRGVMKGFFYLLPTSPQPSSYVAHTLEQYTSNPVAALTYTSRESTDLSIIYASATTVQPYRTSATGTWYAQEFEMAYDPRVATKNAASNRFRWLVNSVNITDANLNGVSQGTVKGTVATPSPPANLYNSINRFVFQAASAASLGSFGFTGVVADALRTAISSGLSGSIRNIANGIFSTIPSTGGGGSTQYVNLTTEVNYKFTGSLSNTSQIAGPALVIPGSANQNNAAGYAPLYTSPLGLMTLSASPTATFTTQMGYDGPEVYDLKFNPNDYRIQWNPHIINSSENGARIQNLKTQILSYEDYYDNNYTRIERPFSRANVERGTRPFYNDALGANNGIRFRAFFHGSMESNNYSITWADMSVGKPLPNHVVRITFDVVPNNGAARVTIAKSFNILLKQWINLPNKR